MKQLFFVAIYILVNFSCNGRSTPIIKPIPDTTKPILPTAFIRKINKDSIIQSYADSLNNFSGGAIPYFLQNICFDYQRTLWESLHSPVSLRWKILIKVKNKNALKTILQLNPPFLNLKCNYPTDDFPNINVPLIDKTFFELIERRYRELS